MTESLNKPESKRPQLPPGDERHGVCLFCTEEVDFTKGNGSKVETLNFATSILGCCETRADDWACIVRENLSVYDGDLPGHGCVYHRSCSTNFRTGKRIPIKYRSSPGKGKYSDQDSLILLTGILVECYFLLDIR